MATRLEPTMFARSIMLEAADIPAHMTIAQWREHRRAEQRTPRRAGRRWSMRRRPR